MMDEDDCDILIYYHPCRHSPTWNSTEIPTLLGHHPYHFSCLCASSDLQGSLGNPNISFVTAVSTPLSEMCPHVGTARVCQSSARRFGSRGKRSMPLVPGKPVEAEGTQHLHDQVLH